MPNGLFKLVQNDFIKGAVVAVGSSIFAAILLALSALVTKEGFDVFTADWINFGKSIVNIIVIVGVSSFSGYIGKNFFSTNKGSVLNVTPEDPK